VQSKVKPAVDKMPDDVHEQDFQDEGMYDFGAAGDGQFEPAYDTENAQIAVPQSVGKKGNPGSAKKALRDVTNLNLLSKSDASVHGSFSPSKSTARMRTSNPQAAPSPAAHFSRQSLCPPSPSPSVANTANSKRKYGTAFKAPHGTVNTKILANTDFDFATDENVTRADDQVAMRTRVHKKVGIHTR
jgi:hypothetical protein